MPPIIAPAPAPAPAPASEGEMIAAMQEVFGTYTSRWCLITAMGRAGKTMLLMLTALVFQSATALGVDGDGETTFTVPLQANHGLSAKLEADDDEIELTVSRKGQQAVYAAPGKVSPEGITVKYWRPWRIRRQLSAISHA